MCIFFHKWEVVKETQKYKYEECSKCGKRRRLERVYGGFKPANEPKHKDWVNGLTNSLDDPRGEEIPRYRHETIECDGVLAEVPNGDPFKEQVLYEHNRDAKQFGMYHHRRKRVNARRVCLSNHEGRAMDIRICDSKIMHTTGKGVVLWIEFKDGQPGNVDISMSIRGEPDA